MKGNRQKRYKIYREALAKLGIYIPDLVRPNKRSIENAKKLWRKAKWKYKDAGMDLGRVDDFAKADKITSEEDITSKYIIESIKTQLEEGLSYISTKQSQAGAIMVNQSSLRISKIIDDAVDKWGYKETADRLIEWAGVEGISELIERLMYAVYDKEYAAWAGGRSAYERKIQSLCEALEVEDTIGTIFY